MVVNSTLSNSDAIRAAPVIRAVERIELPSTKQRMIAARSDLLNLFILTLCVRVVTTVCRDGRGAEKGKR